MNTTIETIVPGTQGRTTHSCGGCCTKLKNFGVRLAGKSILEQINLHIHCGELMAIIGPNGAGKSTLLRAILGEVRHTGSMLFTHSADGKPQKPVIGYVPQHLEFDPNSPVTVLDLFSGFLSRRPLWAGYDKTVRSTTVRALEVVQAGHLLHNRVGSLSGGELQRVLLSLALTPTPEILLLDEPVSGVDPAGIDLFYCMVSRLREDHDLSILLVSHDLPSAATYADRMIFLNKTIICDGTPEEVLSDRVVTQTFGNETIHLKEIKSVNRPHPGRHCATA